MGAKKTVVRRVCIQTSLQEISTLELELINQAQLVKTPPECVPWTLITLEVRSKTLFIKSSLSAF